MNSKNPVGNIIRFFRACYEADNREQNLWDILSKQHELFRYCAEQEAYLLNLGQDLEVGGEYGEKLAHAIKTYQREKTFLYARSFVVGAAPRAKDGNVGPKRLCAPLLLYEASLSSADDIFTVSIDPENYRWNTGLLNLLADSTDNISQLDSCWQPASGQLDLQNVCKWVAENGVDLEFSENIEHSPSQETLQKLAGSRRTDLVLVDASAMVLSKRSIASRGIIDELNTISDAEKFSKPMECLFSRQRNKSSSKPCFPEQVPGLLSKAQKKILQNAAQKNLSLVIGPPGTGKSYTIACMAMERFQLGESVLIVSRNEHAVDVVQDKLIQQLGISSTAIVRAGVNDYHKYLKNYLSDLTTGIGLEDAGPSWDKQLQANRAKIERAEKSLVAKTKQLIFDGLYLQEVAAEIKNNLSFWEKIRIWWLRHHFEKSGFLYDLLLGIQTEQRTREELLAKHINRVRLSALHRTLKYHRGELLTFLSALKARTSLQQKQRFAEVQYSKLLQALPIWLCSLPALHKALPLQKELFDLVIVDEASQCDIASSLPALYRAKRAVVVGDPKQLHHVSFLAKRRETEIASKLGLDAEDERIRYRDASLVDVTNISIDSMDDVVMLDEHYRSLPEIIHFSNQRFYRGDLRVMTEKPVRSVKSAISVEVLEQGKYEKGINKSETTEILSRLRLLIKQQQHLPGELKETIGVLSFFRDQAEYLGTAILENLALSDINAHRIRAGTPYAFQGEERDIMLISCAVDDESKSGSYRYLNREDVFNVAVTRARERQYFYLSLPVEQLPKNILLREYFENTYAKQISTYSLTISANKDIEALRDVLQGHGVEVMLNYPVAGIEMDLVLVRGQQCVAVDLVGFPGEAGDTLHLERYKIFERAGLPIFPLSYVAWIFYRDEVVGKLIALLQPSKETDFVLQNNANSMSGHWRELLATSPRLAKKVARLESELALLDEEDGREQIARIVHRYQKFILILGEKLTPSEFTYVRYAKTAEQVLLAVLDNLKTVVLIWSSVSRPDLDQDEVVAESLLLTDQKKAIDSLLLANEAAIKNLEDISFKWSQTKTVSGETDLGLEHALSELKMLQGRVDRYSI